MITFPPGALGPEPVRLPLLVQTAEFFAVAKPAGIGVATDPLQEKGPFLLEAIAEALKAGKKQLADLGLHHAGRVHGLDIEATGVVVFAATAAAEAALRNAAGSRQIEFVYELLAERRAEPREIVCELPLYRDADAGRMLVSHRRGKKCTTRFTPVRELGRHVLWEARTFENRTHQVRAHAAESGLGIPGEQRYGRVRLVFLSDLKPGFRSHGKEERPLHGPLALHLREVRLPDAGGVRSVSAGHPRSFEAMVSRLVQHSISRPRSATSRPAR